MQARKPQTVTVSLSFIFERNFQPVHGGNPKADQLSLYCITEISCSSWNIFNSRECFIPRFFCRSKAVSICVFHRLFMHRPPFMFLNVRVGRCHRRRGSALQTRLQRSWVGDLSSLLPPPSAYLFMHQRSDLKRVKDCLPLMSNTFPQSRPHVWSQLHFIQLSVSSLRNLYENAPDCFHGWSSTDSCLMRMQETYYIYNSTWIYGQTWNAMSIYIFPKSPPFTIPLCFDTESSSFSGLECHTSLFGRTWE